MDKYLTVMILLFLSSCCKEGVEVNRYLLTDIEKETIPYLTNETIKFNHTNGFEFDLTVSVRQTELKTMEIRHCGDNYSTYESLTVNLLSNIPELFIKIEMCPNECYPPLMTILNDKYYFGLNISSEPDIDTLTLNGKKYNDIYVGESFLADTLIIQPKQVLYNKKVGIIQIVLTNDEKFTINQ